MTNQIKKTIMTKPIENHIIKRKKVYLDNFGEEWYNLLEDFLLSDEMFKIAYNIRLQRKKANIIPEEGSELFFKIFRDLKPKDIKVVILGQDPYPQKDIYDGYAFSNSNSLDGQISPSLKNIIKEIKSNYPDNFVLDRMDWSYLARQGVFPINTALSLRQGIPESHVSLWRPFTVQWINQLAENHKNIVWVLWGKKAHNYEYLLKNKDQKIIKTSHPSPLGCTKKGVTYPAFNDSKCFVDVNNFLEAINKKSINW